MLNVKRGPEEGLPRPDGSVWEAECGVDRNRFRACLFIGQILTDGALDLAARECLGFDARDTKAMLSVMVVHRGQEVSLPKHLIMSTVAVNCLQALCQCSSDLHRLRR